VRLILDGTVVRVRLDREGHFDRAVDCRRRQDHRAAGKPKLAQAWSVRRPVLNKEKAPADRLRPRFGNDGCRGGNSFSSRPNWASEARHVSHK
jgi:hypothetical protein